MNHELIVSVPYHTSQRNNMTPSEYHSVLCMALVYNYQPVISSIDVWQTYDTIYCDKTPPT